MENMKHMCSILVISAWLLVAVSQTHDQGSSKIRAHDYFFGLIRAEIALRCIVRLIPRPRGNPQHQLESEGCQDF